MKRIAAFLVMAAALSCGDDLVFAPELDIDLSEFRKTETGLYIKDVATGAGEEAAPGDTAFVHYTAWYVNAVLLDESGDNPFRFVLGSGDVIPGFDEGVTGMRPGGSRRLVIPPELGYGYSDIRIGGEWIPGGSWLVYDVTLVELRQAQEPPGADP